MARWKMWCFLVFLSILSLARAAERVEGTLEKIYHDKECLGPQALGMGSGRIQDTAIWASSYEPKRPPQQARVGDNPGAWTASTANAFQYIGVDVGERMMITAVETQGRKGSSEYVTEYYLQFSDDRNTWRYYTNEFGMPQIFTGNSDGFAKRRNTLRYPVVARYIRFDPQRWNTRISMRLELYGCSFDSDPATFSDSYIVLDLSQGNQFAGGNQLNNQNGGPLYYIQTIQDSLKLRFRTDTPNGVLFYADGNQGDYIALELKRGYLLFHLNLGSIQSNPGETTAVGGSLLDDFQWHDVIITRDRQSILLVVDRLERKIESNGEFYRLNLDKKVYLGGVPTFNMDGLTIRHNFQGCIENVVFDDIKMIQGARQGLARYQKVGPVTHDCRVSQTIPVTFNSFDSYITADGADKSEFRASFEFRTHNTDGLLVYHQLEGETDEIKVKINQDGHVWYLISTGGQVIEDVVRNNDVESPRNVFNDGLWHLFSLTIDSRVVNCTVDRNSKLSTRALGLNLGKEYWIGGYDTENSFLGCMRKIDVGNKEVDLRNLKPEQMKNVVVGTCGIRDRCTPNPCEHGGICIQDWKTFYCLCDGTGYTGAVCHISTRPLSCLHFKMYSRSKDQEQTIIDVDGSGPLKPFTVDCDVGDVLESSETYVSHDSMSEIKVDGCQNPGCYMRKVTYEPEFDALESVIERSFACRQFINYKCNNSRLLADPEETNPEGRDWITYAWWVGRSYQPQYYWGGASPGSRRCQCGLTENGCEVSLNGKTNICNCDAQRPVPLTDNGYLRHKEHLPVIEMYFGDTGTVTDYRAGWHKLGQLICEGDNMFDNVVTFRKRDATIELPTFDAKSSGDIWFQFKTTQRDGIILHNTGGDDYIQVRIYNGDTIQFSYNAGSGAYNLEYRAPSGLNDNQWHTVHIERNRKQAWVRVDTNRANSRDEPEEQGYRTLDLNSALVVGASVDNRDGFVGCIRGLLVNGKLMDLRGMVDRGEVVYGVTSGCVGKCDSNPCFNGGTCVEKYNGYTCDCAYTPFRGWMCGREVGVNMLKNYMIQYTFDKDQGLVAADGEYIRVGFATKFKQGILLQITDETSSEYISVEMNNNGGVKVALDIGFGRDEVNTPFQGIDYTNGQQHEVVIRRENRGRRLTVQVDDYEPGIGNWGYLPSTADTILDNPKYLYVGRNVSLGPGLGFEGCIYRMQFDNIFPLKRAFQDPRPSYIYLEPKGKILEDMCGFEEITQPPDPVEIRPGAGTVVNVTQPTEFDNRMSQNDQVIIAVCVAAAFLLIVLILVIWCKFRNGGEYHTYEAKGAELADNPDTAIVYNHMGQPDVQKKKEFFI